MATEGSPLLGDPLHHHARSAQHVLPNKNIYDRFTHQQKRAILSLVSLAGLIPTFLGSSFVPSIPQISKDLNVPPASVSLGVSLSVLAISFGVMFWSGYSSFYGRRWIYLAGLPFTAFGSFAVALSTNLTSLLFWRFIQTFGCSGSFAIGAAVIGDIYKLEERGTAMGIVFGAMLLGLAIAPPIGGVLAQYWSWRGFQASLGVWTLIQIMLLALFLPETAYPGSLGIDKQRNSKKLFVWINPFRCLTFLRSPNIMAITLASTFGLLSDYSEPQRYVTDVSLSKPALLIPIAYTLGAKYGITSESLIGALLLSNGLGNFLGAPIAGRVSDMVVRRTKAEGMGEWVPEYRLRAVWLGALVLIPLSITLSGFTTAYVSGTIGLVINLACLFTNGLGMVMVLTPVGTYVVDIMPSQSSEVMAAISALRSLVIALASALLIPSVQTIGVAATDSIVGLLTLFGYFLIWLTIRYGKQMRAYVDIGYPSFDALSGDDRPTL